MRNIVTADIGGTHARFALAAIEDGRVREVDEPVTLKTAEHASFQTAWEEFGRRRGIDLPDELAIAFAGPVGGEVLKLTNNPWVIRPALMGERLGVERFTIVNDFGAVAHAVASIGDALARYEVRVAEMVQSVRIIEQALDQMPTSGPIKPEKMPPSSISMMYTRISSVSSVSLGTATVMPVIVPYSGTWKPM